MHTSARSCMSRRGMLTTGRTSDPFSSCNPQPWDRAGTDLIQKTPIDTSLVPSIQGRGYLGEGVGVGDGAGNGVEVACDVAQDERTA
jgi:hypothetical protein